LALVQGSDRLAKTTMGRQGQGMAIYKLK
jgi:hypothetical protein